MGASMTGVTDVVKIPGTRRPPSTFNGFRPGSVRSGTDVDGTRHIDHLFVRDGHRWQLNPIRCEVITSRRSSNQRQLSDHFGIQCEFRLDGGVSLPSCASGSLEKRPLHPTMDSDRVAKRPRGAARAWEIAKGKNCYDGHGGRNVDLRDD